MWKCTTKLGFLRSKGPLGRGLLMNKESSLLPNGAISDDVNTGVVDRVVRSTTRDTDGIGPPKANLGPTYLVDVQIRHQIA